MNCLAQNEPKRKSILSICFKTASHWYCWAFGTSHWIHCFLLFPFGFMDQASVSACFITFATLCWKKLLQKALWFWSWWLLSCGVFRFFQGMILLCSLEIPTLNSLNYSSLWVCREKMCKSSASVYMQPNICDHANCPHHMYFIHMEAYIDINLFTIPYSNLVKFLYTYF